jgi:hypothetical protein
VVTEVLGLKLRDKGSGGTSSIWGVYPRTYELKKTIVLSNGCQGAYSELQRRQVELCEIEDMGCRKETPFPIG